MPVGFLTDDQAGRYGRFAGEPTPDQLARHFHLDDADRAFVAEHRGDHNRLGVAVQLGSVRLLGAFLDDPTEAPASAVRFAADQLSIAVSADLMTTYGASEGRWRHGSRIRERYGYRAFTDFGIAFRLNRFLYALCWTGTDRPSALFDRAVAWLLSAKVLLPGLSALERAVARVRSRASAHLHRRLSEGVTPEERERLDSLVAVPEGGRQSALDRLRDGPYIQSGPEIGRALARLGEIRAIADGLPQVDRLPPGKVAALARYASAAKAQAVERLPDDRRTATLLAVVRTLEASAGDDVIDLFDAVATTMFTQANTASKEARLRSLRDLDAAALRLRDVGNVLLDEATPDQEVRAAVFALIGRDALSAAVERIGALAEPHDDTYFAELRKHHRKIRYAPALLSRARPRRGACGSAAARCGRIPACRARRRPAPRTATDRIRAERVVRSVESCGWLVRPDRLSIVRARRPAPRDPPARCLSRPLAALRRPEDGPALGRRMGSSTAGGLPHGRRVGVGRRGARPSVPSPRPSLPRESRARAVEPGRNDGEHRRRP